MHVGCVVHHEFSNYLFVRLLEAARFQFEDFNSNCDVSRLTMYDMIRSCGIRLYSLRE